MAIAKVGRDTEMHKAKDEVYKGLSGCCQYDRGEKAGNGNKIFVRSFLSFKILTF